MFINAQRLVGIYNNEADFYRLLIYLSTAASRVDIHFIPETV
jgi:hypothetical protein